METDGINMGSSDCSIERIQYEEGDKQLALLKEIIERLERGENLIGAIRLFRKDGTVQDVAFGPTEADKSAALVGLRRAFNN